MTDRRTNSSVDELYAIPIWAYDPRTHEADQRGTFFGVFVPPLVPGQEPIKALLEPETSKQIEQILNTHGPYLEFCNLEDFGNGKSAGCHLAVQRGGDILLDRDTGWKFKLFRYIDRYTPPWARDPRVLAAELYDGRDMPFGVVVPPLLQEHEFDIAPLGLGLSNIIKRALQKHKKKRLVLSR